MNEQENWLVPGTFVHVVDMMPFNQHPIVSERIAILVDPVRTIITYRLHDSTLD